VKQPREQAIGNRDFLRDADAMGGREVHPSALCSLRYRLLKEREISTTSPTALMPTQASVVDVQNVGVEKLPLGTRAVHTLSCADL